MLLTWKKVESLEMPLEVDCTLSKTDVYYRRNITEEQAENNGEIVKKYIYEETILSEEFRFPILDTEEYKTAIQEKINRINGQLHITKLDFYNNFCKPVGISYEVLIEKIKGSPIKAETENLIHNIGFFLLLGLIIWVTIHDIIRIF